MPLATCPEHAGVLPHPRARCRACGAEAADRRHRRDVRRARRAVANALHVGGALLQHAENRLHRVLDARPDPTPAPAPAPTSTAPVDPPRPGLAPSPARPRRGVAPGGLGRHERALRALRAAGRWPAGLPTPTDPTARPTNER